MQNIATKIQKKLADMGIDFVYQLFKNSIRGTIKQGKEEISSLCVTENGDIFEIATQYRTSYGGGGANTQSTEEKLVVSCIKSIESCLINYNLNKK